AHQRLQRCQLHTLGPICHQLLAGPARRGDAPPKIGQRLLWNVDCEGTDGHLRRDCRYGHMNLLSETERRLSRTARRASGKREVCNPPSTRPESRRSRARFQEKIRTATEIDGVSARVSVDPISEHSAGTNAYRGRRPIAASISSAACTYSSCDCRSAACASSSCAPDSFACEPSAPPLTSNAAATRRDSLRSASNSSETVISWRVSSILL